MSREIKIRAWDNTCNKMIGGYSITDAVWNHSEIRKLPLMQYTGIPNIYEGDTATKTFTEKVGKHSVERTVTGEVIWSTQKAGFVLLVKEYVDDNVFNQKHYELDGCVVTGNIYEPA